MKKKCLKKVKGGTWKVLGSKKIYSDPWIRLRVDKVIRPDGLQGTYSVAEIKGGIGVVTLTSDNKIVIVGQYRYTTDTYSWEIPKGAFSSFSDKTSPLETAKRELKEETGITAKTWKKLTMVHTLLGSTNDKVFLFLAANLIKGKASPGKTEKIEVKQVSFKEFYRMVDRGLITDATSIAAVGLAKRALRGG
jgi:8-oxo-dGTP pyrophosphatase MutT (NUDIX family)